MDPALLHRIHMEIVSSTILQALAKLKFLHVNINTYLAVRHILVLERIDSHLVFKKVKLKLITCFVYVINYILHAKTHFTLEPLVNYHHHWN